MADELNKAYFAIIPANVRYDNDIPPNAKLLYGEITALCNQEGYCWATNDYFSRLYNCTKQSVSSWINKLKEKGYIIVEIVYKEGSKEILNRYIKISEYPIQKKLNTPIQNNLKDNNTSFNNTSNNKKESKERKKTSFDEIITDYAKGDAVLTDLLQEWLKVRKAKRAAMTDRAIKMNIDKLDNIAAQSNMTVPAYLQEVICRGWAAFYVIRNYANAPAAKTVGANGIAINEAPSTLDGVF